MHLVIITPEKEIYNAEIDELVVPTITGEIAILPHHVDLLSQITSGEIAITTKNKTQHLAVTGGFLQITNNTITILADYAVKSEEINTKKALDAQKRAEEILKRKDTVLSDTEIATVQSELRRAIAELKVAHRRHRTFPSQS